MSTHIYKSELVRCFYSALGTSHGNGFNFLNEELLNLTPYHIYTYLSFKGFGASTPLESDKPTQGRPNSIEYAKKLFVFYAKLIDEMGSSKKLW